MPLSIIPPSWTKRPGDHGEVVPEDTSRFWGFNVSLKAIAGAGLAIFAALVALATSGT